MDIQSLPNEAHSCLFRQIQTISDKFRQIQTNSDGLMFYKYIGMYKKLYIHTFKVIPKYKYLSTLIYVK